jgi:hypothetical protein
VTSKSIADPVGVLATRSSAEGSEPIDREVSISCELESLNIRVDYYIKH